MKLIPLTRAQSAIVDDSIYDELNLYKWYANWSPCTKSFYAQRSKASPRREVIAMHRYILSLKKGDGYQADHINGNTLDNRSVNLRKCTPSENKRNRKLHRDNTSGFRGVSWHKQHRKWMAQYSCEGKRKCIGVFKSKKDAAQAYVLIAHLQYGEFLGMR